MRWPSSVAICKASLRAYLKWGATLLVPVAVRSINALCSTECLLKGNGGPQTARTRHSIAEWGSTEWRQDPHIEAVQFAGFIFLLVDWRDFGQQVKVNAQATADSTGDIRGIGDVEKLTRAFSQVPLNFLSVETVSGCFTFLMFLKKPPPPLESLIDK